MANNIEILIQAKDGFSKTFGSFRSGIGTMARGATVGAAAIAGASVALFAITKGTAEAYDKVQKFSDQLGVSTEFLSKMGVAADFSGVATQTFNKSIQKLQVGIGEANRGIGIAKDTFDQLGLSIKDNNGNLKTSEQILPEIADAFMNMSNATERAEAASKLFGQRGIEMLQMFKNGSQGLKDMSAEAEKFGLVISSKAAANAAEFNDSLTRSQGALKGLKNYISEEVMPTMTALSNRFAEFVANNRDKILSFARDSITAMGGFVEFTAYGVAGMVDAWRGLQMTWHLLKVGFSEFAALLNAGLAEVSKEIRMTMELLNFKGIFDSAIEKMDSFEQSQGRVIESMHQMADTAFADLNNIANDGLAIERVTEFAAKIKQTLAELQEEGNIADALTVSDETVAKTLENIEAIKEYKLQSIEELKAMRDELTLSDQEKLTAWHELQLEMYANHKEELALIDEIYAARQSELDERLLAEKLERNQRDLKAMEKFRKAEAKAEKKNAQDKVKTKEAQENALLRMQQVFGIKGFNLYKIINIQDTIMETKAAAVSAYKALAGIPIIGPALGIAAAAAAIMYGMQQVASIKGLSVGGAAHGGLDYVPREQTYLLDRGERVLSPRQNKDLTSALGSGSGLGGNVFVENFIMEIFPNATNADAMLNMTREDWEDIASAKVMPAFRTLANQGQTI